MASKVEKARFFVNKILLLKSRRIFSLLKNINSTYSTCYNRYTTPTPSLSHISPNQQPINTRPSGGPTVNGSLPGQHDHNQLERLVLVAQVPEQRLHLVRSLRVLAEHRRALDGHASVLRDALQLLDKLTQVLILPKKKATIESRVCKIQFECSPIV